MVIHAHAKDIEMNPWIVSNLTTIKVKNATDFINFPNTTVFLVIQTIIMNFYPVIHKSLLLQN